MSTLAPAVINTTQGFVLFRDCTIQETDEGWIALDEFAEEVAWGRTLFECVDAVDNWHDNRAEAAWLDHQQSLMESGGHGDSAHRRQLIEAGRGHLISSKGAAA